MLIKSEYINDTLVYFMKVTEYFDQAVVLMYQLSAKIVRPDEKCTYDTKCTASVLHKVLILWSRYYKYV